MKNKGGKREGAGRKVGSTNRPELTLFKTDLIRVHQELGYNHLRDWAKDHPSEYYKILAGILPKEITGSLEMTHDVTLRWPEDDSQPS